MAKSFAHQNDDPVGPEARKHLRWYWSATRVALSCSLERAFQRAGLPDIHSREGRKFTDPIYEAARAIYHEEEGKEPITVDAAFARLLADGRGRQVP